MLTQLYRFLDPSRINAELIQRLRALADDAERLQQTQSAPSTTLQATPILEYWVSVQKPEGVRLIGQLEDCMIITSPLWFADPEGNWVRTLSRFYRLGPPANPCETSLIATLKIEPRDARGDNELEDDA